MTDNFNTIHDGLTHWVDALDAPGFGQPMWDPNRPDHRDPLPKTLRTAVLLRDWFGCHECGNRFGEMHVDHVTPVAGGGTNHTTNLQALCARCNEAKSNLHTIALATARPRIIVAGCRHQIPELAQDRSQVTAFCASCRATRQLSTHNAEALELSHVLGVCPCDSCRQHDTDELARLDATWTPIIASRGRWLWGEGYYSRGQLNAVARLRNTLHHPDGYADA